LALIIGAPSPQSHKEVLKLSSYKRPSIAWLVHSDKSHSEINRFISMKPVHPAWNYCIQDMSRVKPSHARSPYGLENQMRSPHLCSTRPIPKTPSSFALCPPVTFQNGLVETPPTLHPGGIPEPDHMEKLSVTGAHLELPNSSSQIYHLKELVAV